jgi:hypothetical protein
MDGWIDGYAARYRPAPINRRQRQPLRFWQSMVCMLLLADWLRHNVLLVSCWVQTTVRTTSTSTKSTRLLSSASIGTSDSINQQEKDRPSLQRVDGPRPARRLNLPFKYLYRHDFDSTLLPSDPTEFLWREGGYSMEQIRDMNCTFPPLLQLSVRRHLYPKLMFLKHTLSCRNPSELHPLLPPAYFGARLERILAPCLFGTA